jgi:2-dehydropantoate 2-reductase
MESKILIYGAGVIGSIFAGKLLRSGIDVTILARGNRYDEITTQGLILKNAMNNNIENYNINLIKKLDKDDLYDFIIVAAQNT